MSKGHRQPLNGSNLEPALSRALQRRRSNDSDGRSFVSMTVAFLSPMKRRASRHSSMRRARFRTSQTRTKSTA
jgi:hypothetical protein